MKLTFVTVLAAISLSLLACDEKKEEAKPAPTAAGVNTITVSATAAASAKPAAGTGGW